MTAPDRAALDAHLVDVPVAPDHRDGVLRFLALAAEMAATVEAAPWDARHADLAPDLRLPGSEGA